MGEIVAVTFLPNMTRLPSHFGSEEMIEKEQGKALGGRDEHALTEEEFFLSTLTLPFQMQLAFAELRLNFGLKPRDLTVILGVRLRLAVEYCLSNIVGGGIQM